MSTAPSDPLVRISTGPIPLSSLPSFPWEHPIPITPFWSSIPYTAARNVLQSLSADTISSLALDTPPHCTLPTTQKCELLLKIVEGKIREVEQEEFESEKNKNRKAWEKLMLAAAALHSALPSPLNTQIAIAEQLAQHRADTSNLSYNHNLAGLLVERGGTGDLERAQKMAREVQGWLEGKLGVDAPQVMGARRTVMRAVWGLGRWGEAGVLRGEMEGLIKGMKGGVYGEYEGEERRLLEECWEGLKEGGEGVEGGKEEE